MTETTGLGIVAQQSRSQWVRLRTLIWLRWVAIAGQIMALGAAWVYFDLRPPLGPIFMTIGSAVIANLAAIFLFPRNTRLTESGAMLWLLFDLVQLSVLLALTGGLNNPFALLVLAPVTIAATALRLQPTLILALSAGALVTAMGFVNLPLVDVSGTVHALPEMFRFGFWVAIVIGIAFLSVYASRVTSEINLMSDALLATQMALTREQKLTDLGGVVAAYAHELGTPLATIKLVSAELLDDLADHPDLQEDAALIRAQADRCRDILQSMGRVGKDDRQMHGAPFAAVVSEAAEPHQDRGKTLLFELIPTDGADPRQPMVQRRPEIIHGLRNLVQNAVDFAASTVWIELYWSDSQVGVRIMDDGQGFTPQALERIGDPFLRHRRNEPQRPGYEGMGLGLFIAKTLLERTGADLSFANGRARAFDDPASASPSGAVIEVIWPRANIESASATGENAPLRP